MPLDYEKAKSKTQNTQVVLGHFSDLFAALTFIFLFLFIIILLQNNTHSANVKLQAEKLDEKYKAEVDSISRKFEKRARELNNEVVSYVAGANQSEQGLYDELKSKLSTLVKKKRRHIEDTQEKISQEQKFIDKAKLEIDRINSLEAMVTNLVDQQFAMKQKLRASKIDIERKAAEEKKKIELDHVTVISRMERKFEDKLKKLIKDKDRKNKAYEAKLQLKQEELQKQLSRIELVNEKLDVLEKESQSYKDKNISLQKEKTKTQENFKKLERQFADATKKNTEVSQLRSQQEHKVDALQQNIDQLKLEKANLLAERDHMLAQQENLQEEMKKVYQGVGTLKRKLAGARQANKTIKNTQGSLSEENKHLLEKLDESEKRESIAKREFEDLEKKHGKLKNDLTEVDSRKQYTREICDSLEKAFEKKGIQANIDYDSGEVVIPFEQSYFDFDSDALTQPMKEQLKKVIPTFAETVLGNSVGAKIQSLQLTGYASPIYRGKLMDADKTDEVSQAGLSYNMDLSYRRARSIFDYIFNHPEEISYEFRDQMMKITTVSSRSYLVSDLEKQNNLAASEIPEGLSAGRVFCLSYNCDAWHKVSIRFVVE